MIDKNLFSFIILRIAKPFPGPIIVSSPTLESYCSYIQLFKLILSLLNKRRKHLLISFFLIFFVMVFSRFTFSMALFEGGIFSKRIFKGIFAMRFFPFFKISSFPSMIFPMMAYSISFFSNIENIFFRFFFSTTASIRS